MNFAVFTDESGEFSSPSLPLGKYVTVAVILTGTRATAEAGALAAFQTARAPLPFHAAETTHPPDVARALLREAPPRCTSALADMLRSHGPDDVQSWRGDSNAHRFWRELKSIGATWLVAGRRAATELIDNGGRVFVCLQHGQAPEPDQWGLMMQAVVEEALFAIACDGTPGDSHFVDLIIADRGGRRPFDLGRALDLLAAARAKGATKARISCDRLIRTVEAEESPGIQVADVFAHALGPGPLVHRPVSLQEAMRLDLSQLRSEARTWTSVRASGVLHPGGARVETHGNVLGVVEDLGSGIDPGPTRIAGLDRARRSLPDYSYLCSVQGTLKLAQIISSTK
jgi:hypothetical protein